MLPCAAPGVGVAGRQTSTQRGVCRSASCDATDRVFRGPRPNVSAYSAAGGPPQCSIFAPEWNPSTFRCVPAWCSVTDPSTALGSLARELGFTRTLIVADKGIVAAGLRRARGQPARGRRHRAVVLPRLRRESRYGHGRSRARRARRRCGVDSIVAIGGGSSLDCAKGINFVLTNGGSMRDYRGHGKASRPMLPSIGVPDDRRHRQRGAVVRVDLRRRDARQDGVRRRKAAFRIAILDPALTVSQPRP